MTSTGQSHFLKQMAQLSLCTAISSERAKHWEKAIEHYKKLLKILNTIKISEKGEMDPQFKQLLYESHYHLGIALQNVNGHEEAVRQYTKALQASSIWKKTCAVGCTAGTCLHTPVLTRRAFAFMKCGETRKSLRDAHAAVVSDRLNPDVYCIRALVRCTMQKEEEAIKDLNYGLLINPSHVCSLILRGNIKRCIGPENNASLLLNEDQEQALAINHSSMQFLGVKDFNSSEIPAFYNNLLWSLNVPHTVISVRLPSACSRAQDVSFHLQRAFSAPASRNQNPDQHQAPCHANGMTRNATKSGLERRLNYGRAVTAYSAGLRGNGKNTLRNIAQLCDTSTGCTRSSFQKSHESQKISEETGFSVYEINRSGTLARMYNKPWIEDKFPFKENAKKTNKNK
ncbi:uncharacterized protein [Dendrobates tinctorius]|uniref:uncharacterized protein n=1 Tax=Dendrobates tinctorius TaxID=92724 RepID=UPI003CCA43A3